MHAAFAESVRSGFLELLSGGAVGAVVLSTILVLLGVSGLVVERFVARARSSAARDCIFLWESEVAGNGTSAGDVDPRGGPGGVDSAAVLIPLMCYHPSQLVLAGILSGRWGRAK